MASVGEENWNIQQASASVWTDVQNFIGSAYS